MLSSRDRERLLAQLGGRRVRRSPGRIILSSINWEIVAGFLIILGFIGYALWIGDPRVVPLATLAFVIVGWVFSLCLHEFTHAAVAVFGGDDSDSTQRYLSFNPLHYVNPLMSIILPVLFILLGGIALPGGAVYLRRDLVRSRVWQSAISLGAPLSNLLLGGLLALPIRFGLFADHPALAEAVALLAFFTVMAGVINLLPIPPLDGFGVISPWLPAQVQATVNSFGLYSILILFVLFWYVPGFSDAIDAVIFGILGAAGVNSDLVIFGWRQAFFWQQIQY